MDAAERLIPADVAASTLTATEHLQRYRWAAALAGGRRVLDLCCGVGYGSLILAETAETVHGVDSSAEAIETAVASAAADATVSFEEADALEVLQRDLYSAYDTIVCFEGIEHLPGIETVSARLAHFAAAGGRVLLSLPNSRTFGEVNRFHLTDFDHSSAMEFFEHFPARHVLLQHVAEGTIIVPYDSEEWPESAKLVLTERGEALYANNYLLASNVEEHELGAAQASMRFEVAPYYNRELQSRARANEELWATNRQLGRYIDELRTAADGAAAQRAGRPSAAMALTRVAREREELAAATLELEHLRAEVEALGAERGLAWHRYNLLRERRAVRWALSLAARNPLSRG